ncbi:MAG: helix-turn-helix domain-containing protein [Lysinibacillus sp.]
MAFEYLEQYATFDAVHDMDLAVEQHMAAHFYSLTESERAIVFKLARHSLEHTGACHLKASTIAGALEISTKTVYRSVAKLAALGIIEKVPGTKLNGIKGASIYRILPYVPSSVSQRVTTYEANNEAVCKQYSENQSSKSFNLLKTCSLQEIYHNAHAEKETCKQYMNAYQVMLFDFMHSLPLADSLKDELHKVVLASQINSMKAFVTAKNVIFNMAMDIKEGTLTIASTLRAVFVGVYGKAIGRREYRQLSKPNFIEETPNRGRSVPFYNWLCERDCQPPSISRRADNLENWLAW